MASIWDFSCWFVLLKKFSSSFLNFLSISLFSLLFLSVIWILNRRLLIYQMNNEWVIIFKLKFYLMLQFIIPLYKVVYLSDHVLLSSFNIIGFLESQSCARFIQCLKIFNEWWEWQCINNISPCKHEESSWLHLWLLITRDLFQCM